MTKRLELLSRLEKDSFRESPKHFHTKIPDLLKLLSATKYPWSESYRASLGNNHGGCTKAFGEKLKRAKFILKFHLFKFFFFF